MSADKGLKYLLERNAVRVVEQEEVKKIIPHRAPMLFVDSVRIIEEAKYFVGIRTFRPEEDFFKGHYPGYPIVPGVLLVESMAQSFGTAVMTMDFAKGKTPLFIGAEEAKFKCPVKPGDTVYMAIEALRVGKISRMYGEAYVNGELCASAKLNFVVGERDLSLT